MKTSLANLLFLILFPFTNFFSGTGESVQDIGPIRQPLPIQFDQSGRVVGSVRGPVGDAWIQVEVTQNQDSLDIFKTNKKYWNWKCKKSRVEEMEKRSKKKKKNFRQLLPLPSAPDGPGQFLGFVFLIDRLSKTPPPAPSPSFAPPPTLPRPSRRRWWWLLFFRCEYRVILSCNY